MSQEHAVAFVEYLLANEEFRAELVSAADDKDRRQSIFQAKVDAMSWQFTRAEVEDALANQFDDVKVTDLSAGKVTAVSEVGVICCCFMLADEGE